MPERYSRPWEKEDVERLRKMYFEEGISYRTIAKEMQRSASAVAGKIDRLDFTKSRKVHPVIPKKDRPYNRREWTDPNPNNYQRVVPITLPALPKARS